MPPLLSFGIPTYRRAAQVEACVRRILESQVANFEVVVSDNASGDDTIERLSAIHDPRLKVFSNPENLLFKGNIFKLVERCRGDFIFFLSDEDHLEVGAIPKLLDLASSDPELAVIMGGVNRIDGRPYRLFPETRKIFDSSIAFAELAFQHAYLSGLILNRKKIKLDALRLYLSREEFIYTHELIACLNFFAGHTVLSDQIFCTQGAPVNDFSDKINNQSYWKITPRLFQWMFHSDFLDTIRDRVSFAAFLRVSFRLSKTAASCVIREGFLTSWRDSMEVMRFFIKSTPARKPRRHETFFFWLSVALFIVRGLKTRMRTFLHPQLVGQQCSRSSHHEGPAKSQHKKMNS